MANSAITLQRQVSTVGNNLLDQYMVNQMTGMYMLSAGQTGWATDTTVGSVLTSAQLDWIMENTSYQVTIFLPASYSP